MKLNLDIKKEEKVMLGTPVYVSTHAILKQWSDVYNVSINDLVRHAINNMIDEGI